MRSLPLAWFPAAVLAVAALLLVVLLGIFSFRGYWAKPGADGPKAPSTRQQEQVLAAAKTCFATLNSYDYRKLDEALSAGEKCTTGKFTTDYRNVVHHPGEEVRARPEDGAQHAGQQGRHRVDQLRRQAVGRADLRPAVPGEHPDVLVRDAAHRPARRRGHDGPGRQRTWLVAKIDNDAGNGLSS